MASRSPVECIPLSPGPEIRIPPDWDRSDRSVSGRCQFMQSGHIGHFTATAAAVRDSGIVGAGQKDAA